MAVLSAVTALIESNMKYAAVGILIVVAIILIGCMDLAIAMLLAVVLATIGVAAWAVGQANKS